MTDNKTPSPSTHVLGPDRPHDGPEHNDESDRNSEKSCHSQIGVVMTNPGEPPVGSLVSIGHISAPCDQNPAPNTNRDDFSKDSSPRSKIPGISQELMGLIVDEVFDGAIEDARVIEEIYAVIKRHETSPQHTLLTMVSLLEAAKTSVPCCKAFGLELLRIGASLCGQSLHCRSASLVECDPCRAGQETLARLSDRAVEVFEKVVVETVFATHFSPQNEECRKDACNGHELAGDRPLSTPAPQQSSKEADLPVLSEASLPTTSRLSQLEARKSCAAPVNDPLRLAVALSLDAEDGLKRELVNQLTHVIHYLEHLPVDDVSVQNLFAQHLSGREDGFLIGEIITGKLGSFGILMESTVFSDMEVVAGHDADSVSSRTSVHAVSSERDHPNLGGSFQDRVQPWMMACFGEMISGDREERNHRFLEEALELVQSTGCTAHEAHQLVNYVYGRDTGEPHQEVGGVMVTLAALCLANALDMHQCGETELTRIWTKVEAIRAKQAAKPKHSPLPGPSATAEGKL